LSSGTYNLNAVNQSVHSVIGSLVRWLLKWEVGKVLTSG